MEKVGEIFLISCKTDVQARQTVRIYIRNDVCTNLPFIRIKPTSTQLKKFFLSSRVKEEKRIVHIRRFSSPSINGTLTQTRSRSKMCLLLYTVYGLYTVFFLITYISTHLECGIGYHFGTYFVCQRELTVIWNSSKRTMIF